jgi:hypothetical protein
MRLACSSQKSHNPGWSIGRAARPHLPTVHARVAIVDGSGWPVMHGLLVRPGPDQTVPCIWFCLKQPIDQWSTSPHLHTKKPNRSMIRPLAFWLSRQLVAELADFISFSWCWLVRLRMDRIYQLLPGPLTCLAYYEFPKSSVYVRTSVHMKCTHVCVDTSNIT